jgi:crotonobetainyl-CoA:carnitine CoA-transferase CaiB-like acyl-CoA transferase
MKLDMRVVSFCHYLQGPAATQYLADLGADVIKVEPIGGAFERHWSGGKSFVNGVSAFLLSANRNKRSLAVNLKNPKSRNVMLKLIESADVVVENFRPGVLEKLGYGYESIRKRKPDIVYASATGLGADGPEAARPGQDLLMQARSGLVAVTGGNCPTVVGAAVVDQHGASLLAMGILAAFVRKLQTGKGTRVETSLLQAALDLQTEALTKYFAHNVEGDVMKRGANIGSWYHDAPYGAYELADCHIVLSMNDPLKLAAALDSDSLRDLVGIDRYEERERYASAVAIELRGRHFHDIAPCLENCGVWFERIQSYDDLENDRQLQHIGAFTEFPVGDKRVKLVSHPLRYDGACPETRFIPLQPGCDSRAILAECGLDNKAIDTLVDEGVVGSYTRTNERVKKKERTGDSDE